MVGCGFGQNSHDGFHAMVVVKRQCVHTRKLVESFLIKNTENMNSYEVSVKIDNVTSELLKKNVKSLNALLNKLENG